MNGPLAAGAAYSHRMMVEGRLWTLTSTTDAGGGASESWTDTGAVDVQLVSPSPAEREVAVQQGQEITHTAVMPTGTAARRGDRLVVAGVTVELVTDPTVATHSSVARASVNRTSWQTPTS